MRSSRSPSISEKSWEFSWDETRNSPALTHCTIQWIKEMTTNKYRQQRKMGVGTASKFDKGSSKKVPL